MEGGLRRSHGERREIIATFFGCPLTTLGDLTLHQIRRRRVHESLASKNVYIIFLF